MLVDKPAGMTSHDVVSVARRALGERRIGHAGTLDPFATGLLVLMLGRATRLLPYLDGEPKVYEATIRFGSSTDTDDLTGEVTATAPPPTAAGVEGAIAGLTGRILQRPPAYSAKRVEGTRAYAAARRGAPLQLEPVPVTVHGWDVMAWRDGELDARITCSGGTYIRALARDLGAAARSAAHLSRLRRVRSGRFDVADAVPLDDVRAGDAAVLPPLAAVPHLPVRSLSSEEVARIGRGQSIPSGDVGAALAALVDDAGSLLAIAEGREGQLHPRMVMHAQ